jgi:hypothetical protein
MGGQSGQLPTHVGRSFNPISTRGDRFCPHPPPPTQTLLLSHIAIDSFLCPWELSSCGVHAKCEHTAAKYGYRLARAFPINMMTDDSSLLIQCLPIEWSTTNYTYQISRYLMVPLRLVTKWLRFFNWISRLFHDPTLHLTSASSRVLGRPHSNLPCRFQL